MNRTKIPWCDYTWNPITGCSPESEGCKNCYAEDIAKRFKMPWGAPVFHPEKLNDKMPRKPSRILVNSMSDLFHESIGFETVEKILGVVTRNPQHTFIVLTKRAKRMFECLGTEYSREDIASTHGQFPEDIEWPLPNLWLGISAESRERFAERIFWLLKTPAARRLVSFEPLLESISCHRYHLSPVAMCDCALSNIELLMPSMEPDFKEHPACPNCGQPYKTITGLDWVICGPKKGPRARLFDLNWARSLRDRCKVANVPFFFKGNPKGGYLLDGVKHFNWPEAAR